MNTLSSFVYSVPLLLGSVILGISSSSLFFLWLSLEVNMLIFLVFLFSDSAKTLKESLMKYFIIQSLSSVGVIWGVFFSSSLSFSVGTYFMGVAALLKLGAAPVHSWYLSLMQLLSWVNIALLSSVQKIMPLFLMSSLKMPISLIWAVVVMSGVLGVFILTKMLLKTILAYSSVFNLSWMVISLDYPLVLVIFLFGYFIGLFSITLWLELYNKESFSQDFNFFSKGSSVMLVVCFMSLGGIPPTVGFVGKICVLSVILEAWSFYLGLYLMLCSLPVVYSYMIISEGALFKKFNKLMSGVKFSFSMSGPMVLIMSPILFFF